MSTRNGRMHESSFASRAFGGRWMMEREDSGKGTGCNQRCGPKGRVFTESADHGIRSYLVDWIDPP